MTSLEKTSHEIVFLQVFRAIDHRFLCRLSMRIVRLVHSPVPGRPWQDLRGFGPEY